MRPTSRTRGSRSRPVTSARCEQAGLSFQRTRTWKASPDPGYEQKAARILELCESPPADGSVVSFDQMGPVSLRPTAGAGWAPKGRPERRRADYNRRSGIRYVFGAYDVHADRLRVRLRPGRAGSDVLTFMHQIRLAYPARRRIYWIQDNLSANWVPPIRAFAAANRIELVPTPTYASYLNKRSGGVAAKWLHSLPRGVFDTGARRIAATCAGGRAARAASTTG